MSLCLEKRGRRLGGGRLEGGGGARAVCQLQFQVASVFAVVLRTIKVRENLMLIELNLQTMPQWAAGYSREIGQENRRKIEGGWGKSAENAGCFSARALWLAWNGSKSDTDARSQKFPQSPASWPFSSSSSSSFRQKPKNPQCHFPLFLHTSTSLTW